MRVSAEFVAAEAQYPEGSEPRVGSAALPLNVIELPAHSSTSTPADSPVGNGLTNWASENDGFPGPQPPQFVRNHQTPSRTRSIFRE